MQPIALERDNRLVFSVLLCAATLCGACKSVAAAEDAEARSLPEWESAFKNADPRWRGADASYSVPLGAGRVLWLFGDTWITDADAKGREGGRLIRNTIAIQNVDGGNPGGVDYYWKTDPKSEAPGNAAPVFAPEKGPGWLWPLSGVTHGWKLYLFMSRLVESSEGLGFAGAGNVLAIVENPEARPAEWWTRQYDIPFFRHTKNGDRVFGLASVIEDETLYVYGIRENWDNGFGGRELIVAQTPIEALGHDDFQSWRFWDGKRWVADVDAAAPLFDEAASEMSIHFDKTRRRFAAVYTRFGLSGEIMLRESPLPEGPWGDARVVYRCPEAEKRMTYAAKAHPELSGDPNSLVITYATNSTELADHLKDMEMYWPRFVRISLPVR